MVEIKTKFQNNSYYIIARGTKSKQHYIGTRFNTINDSITHIGIGLSISSVLKIYNVNPVKGANAFEVESFESFINESDLCYYGIWKLELETNESDILKSVIEKLDTAGIRFDFDFKISSDFQKLYCSEFVWMLLKSVNEIYNFKPISKDTKLLGLSGILKRDVLVYIPVDFFLAFNNLTFIESWAK